MKLIYILILSLLVSNIFSLKHSRKVNRAVDQSKCESCTKTSHKWGSEKWCKHNDSNKTLDQHPCKSHDTKSNCDSDKNNGCVWYAGDGGTNTNQGCMHWCSGCCFNNGSEKCKFVTVPENRADRCGAISVETSGKQKIY